MGKKEVGSVRKWCFLLQLSAPLSHSPKQTQFIDTRDRHESQRQVWHGPHARERILRFPVLLLGKGGIVSPKASHVTGSA